ncbi:MAG: patatin-like phospholipase family protein [Bdellovibrionales bacterium]|nr:patatin-like phospholipase family protein [Bdellovibrionales bacterium]
MRARSKTAVVLSGGGTRGAYEAGVIHYIRTKLPHSLGEKLLFNIYLGSSVGAINASFMAATAEKPYYQGQKIVELWEGINTTDIYRRGPFTLGKFLFKTMVAVSSHLFGIKSVKPDDRALNFRGLFDTQPFFHFLTKSCPWQQLHKNIEMGRLDALVVSATNVHTGIVELFVEHRDPLPSNVHYHIRSGRIQAKHVIASAALPVLFPPVPIHGVYYNDGGLRLKTPLAPAVSLGANRILIIGTRYNPPLIEFKEPSTQPEINIQMPSLANVLGKFFNAIFLDRLDTDREQLNRINRILDACQKNLDPHTFARICADSSTLPIETVMISPSIDIATFVDETMRDSYKNLKSMGVMERAMLRILEIDEEQGSDLLSYFLFEKSYIKKLVDLGFQDAKAKHDELVDFAEKCLNEANT